MTILPNPEDTSCILIGLPESGKSTFIAALWHVVESEELKGSYIISSLPQDAEYLNTLRSDWLNCKDIERTKTERRYEITLDIKEEETGTGAVLLFPDVSGEMYVTQFESRRISNEYRDLLEEINGIILFINPDKVIKPKLIADVLPVLSVDENSEDEKTSDIPWDPSNVPTQVILTDLLQIAGIKGKYGHKLAVIVSAWDVVIDLDDEEYKNLSPVDWIAKELPLLNQFIKSNYSKDDCAFFGVSAQGAPYNEIWKEKLLNMQTPSARIRVQVENDLTNDITLPLKWMMKR